MTRVADLNSAGAVLATCHLENREKEKEQTRHLGVTNTPASSFGLSTQTVLSEFGLWIYT
jgi:hypothetical protein